MSAFYGGAFIAGLFIACNYLPFIACPLPSLVFAVSWTSYFVRLSSRPSHLPEPHLLEPLLPEPKLSGGGNYAQKWNLNIAARDLQKELAAVSKESQYHRAVGIDLGLSQCPELIEIVEPFSLV